MKTLDQVIEEDRQKDPEFRKLWDEGEEEIMGQWSMHIEGAGIHDNGRSDDAEAMLLDFIKMLSNHHNVDSVTFIVGSTRDLDIPNNKYVHRT